MILRMSVRDAGTSAGGDVEVVADKGTRVGSILAALPVSVHGRPCFAGNTPLDPGSTLARSPLVQGAVISVGGPGPEFRVAAEHGEGVAGVLRVVRGPDAGLSLPLRPGNHPVARDSRAAVCLRDSDVSRREHARLEVSPDGAVAVVDRGSTNGTFVDGRQITGQAALPPGGVLRIGADELSWTPRSRGVLRARRSADGRIEFDRAFAPAPAIPATEVALPARQAAQSGAGLATALATLLPVGGAVVLAVATKNPNMLWLSLFGVLGYLVTSAATSSREHQREKAFATAAEAAAQKITEHVRAEQDALHRLSPAPGELAETASGVRADLWARRADMAHGLVLRVGVADRPAAVTLRGEPWEGLETPVLRSVPVTADLRAAGVFGVVGGGEPARALLRWLVLQLATLRGPDDLRLVVLVADGGDRLDWTRWLPHVDAGAHGPCWIGNTPDTRVARVRELRTLVATRTAERRAAAHVRFAEEVVVVLDGALALRDLPGMNEILHDGPPVGVYAVCADLQSMNECTGLCQVDAGRLRLTRAPADLPVEAEPDGFDAATAERLARALAPMRDRLTLATAQNAIPDAVRFLDLLGISVPSAADVRTLWGEGRGPRTRVVLGADASGPVSVDLAGQGPHTMLGGATGAGKSILLQTLVTSLLLANRPDELNLVLVDFKGGSAFLPFERCPHVVALIRSTGETPADVFDEAAAARTLASIRAEVSRRESLLARYEGEIDRYWQRRRANPELPPLPRLVLIFDEFARVLETSPDFVKELVNVAAKGRSLGMHLVLATQSLQGKLSPELKNNISLRISLRQNEPADSAEVLGVPDAAALPGSLRGRGMIVCTTAESRVPQVFQSGYLGAPPPTGGAAPARVRVLGRLDLGMARTVAAPEHGDTPTDQDLSIAAIEEAAGQVSLPAPFRPLLPPLPVELDLDPLAGDLPRTAAPFGLADVPKEQAQPVDFLDLAGRDRLMVAGGPQSGRTTFARTLIAGIAARFRADEVHVYVVEHHPGGLSAFADLPHCGGVFPATEPDRVRRLVTWLERETGRRTTRDGLPAIVVVIDGWELFEDHSDPMFTPASLAGTLRGVITKGAPLGIHVVAIGGQDMLNHKLPALYSRRLLLPFPKEETRRMHLTLAMAGPPVLPGRAIDAATGRHVQICRPVSGTERRDADPARLPRRFPPLPARTTVAGLVPPEPPPSATWIPVGVGGPDCTAIGLDLFRGGRHLLLVSGPAESGKTTAAAVVAASLRRVGIGVLAVAPPRSPLARLLPDDPGVRVLTDVTIKDADLREAVATFGDSPYTVVLDDADHVTLLPTQEGFTDAPTLLDEISRPGARGRQALVLTADATPLLGGFPGPLVRLVNAALTTGARLVLTPADRAVAVAHHLTLDVDQYFTGPPGRGYLATHRDPVLLQVASPDREEPSRGNEFQL